MTEQADIDRLFKKLEQTSERPINPNSLPVLLFKLVHAVKDLVDADNRFSGVRVLSLDENRAKMVVRVRGEDGEDFDGPTIQVVNNNNVMELTTTC